MWKVHADARDRISLRPSVAKKAQFWLCTGNLKPIAWLDRWVPAARELLF
jgi:hypothetical protein